ncbi:hypothetical protein GB931_16675 [Modestobacter sp. I12A-02628]|uniref:Uncharacterized protein n=1 Tax=Goekera deserti TaxID=2497753 RepID=A0A7K3WCL3_9ACTN|nr:hypothetical protein [Goekera deserti]MPQ99520.1 hypothetical protein [Goekera deserti]NDI49007.1 hypothetical protein [Goekera deserti]NEL54202.1 hypothetical protein [Goekera deserti]
MTRPPPGRLVVRLPHWMDAAARHALGASLRSALDGGELHPVDAVQLEDVLTELQVAGARDMVWPESGDRVRRAVGLAGDVVPVRLSAGELASVLGLADLPESLRAGLTTSAGVR